MAKAVTAIKKSNAKVVKKPVAAKAAALPVAKKKPVAASKPAGKKAAVVAKKKSPVKTAVKVTKPKKTVKKEGGKAGTKKTGANLSRYKCKLCGYVYSPLRGEPHNGIPA